MSNFMPEFHQLNIDESNGLLATILIGLSFHRRDVYFELHKWRDGYKLYWCFETFIDEIADIYRKVDFEGKNQLKTIEDLLENEHIQKIVKENTVQNSQNVAERDIPLFEELLKGLPELDRRAPQGLDGHSYTITIKGNPDKRFRAWCVIPKEWSIIKDVVDVLRQYAKLGNDYAVIGID